MTQNIKFDNGVFLEFHPECNSVIAYIDDEFIDEGYYCLTNEDANSDKVKARIEKLRDMMRAASLFDVYDVFQKWLELE